MLLSEIGADSNDKCLIFMKKSEIYDFECKIPLAIIEMQIGINIKLIECRKGMDHFKKNT